MQKFIQFNDQVVDSFLFMQLQDLAVTLSKIEDLNLEFAFQSFFDPIQPKVTISHFWDHRSQMEMVNGFKSDIYLRCIGNVNYSDFKEFKLFIHDVKKTKLTEFAKQFFMLAEDFRIEELCKQERPGTASSFEIRRKIYRKYFESQLNANVVKSFQTDALFNLIYLMLTANSPFEQVPSINNRIDLVIPFVRDEAFKIFEAKSTKDIATISHSIVDVLEEVLEKDMLLTYFHLPELYVDYDENNMTFDELKRKDPLKNDDKVDEQKSGDEDVHEESLPIWHRETSDKTESFLQFDLDQGSQSNLLGEGVREGDTGDQAMAMVQGASKKSNQKDYSEVEAMESKHDLELEGGGEKYGKENRFAFPLFIKPDRPMSEEITMYHQQKSEVQPFQKRLKQMIQKTLEHKKILPRSDLHFGRLNKKLIRMLTEENPRLFYKKQEPSSEIDAVFSLLVDCSASMYDKMDQTKLGIILFHEALKSVLVPHQIVGFWEDTDEASEERQPNYFKTVVDYQSSLRKNSGPEIMQLEAEEDNRDGLAIRILTERLMQRHEKQKFLLVFSDGEPAAFGYEQNGIIDTHEAVVEARKQGIEVINVFLSNGLVDEGQQKIIENIYGKYSIFVENIEELPEVLFPLLKKLLLQSI